MVEALEALLLLAPEWAHVAGSGLDDNLRFGYD